VAASDLVDIDNICIDDVQIILIVDDVLQIGKDAAEDLHEILNGVGGIRGKCLDHGENHEFVGFVPSKAEGERSEISVRGACGGRSVQEGIDHCDIAVPAVDCGNYLACDGPEERLAYLMVEGAAREQPNKAVRIMVFFISLTWRMPSLFGWRMVSNGSGAV